MGMWQQELRFLSEIDRYRYNKYFYLPYLCGVIGCSVTDIPAKPPDADLAQVHRLLGEIQIDFGRLQADTPLTCLLMTVPFSIPFNYVDRIFRLDFSTALKAVEGGRITPQENSVKGARKLVEDARYSIAVGQMLDAGVLVSELTAVTESVLSDSLKLALKVVEMIRTEESVDINVSTEME